MQCYRAHAHGEPSLLQLDTVEPPRPGDEDLLIDVHAIGLNFPDVLLIRGQYQFQQPIPFIPGKEIAGVIREVGAKVQGFRPGDRVMSQLEAGAYAEQVVAQPGSTFRLPDSMSFQDGAAMGLVYQTAYFALKERGQLRPGETVLVGGAAGGVGLAAVQIAKGLGATVVAGVRGDDAKAIVKAAGADYVIDLSGDNQRDSIREQIRALPLDGATGIDVVIDPVGGDFFAGAIRALAWCGRLVVLGFAAGQIPSLKVNYLLLKNISVLGLQWSDYRDRTPERMAEAQQHLFDMWQRGIVRPHVSQSYDFSELPQAVERVATGKVRGKAVVNVTRDP